MKSDYYTYKIVLKQTSDILILLGGLQIFPCLVSLIYLEWYSAAGFIIAGLSIALFGYLQKVFFSKAAEPMFNHSLIIAATAWLLITLFGGLPFYVIAHITPIDVMNGFIPHGSDYTLSSLVFFKNPLHCIFESASAYTTTGLSMAVREPSVGQGVLFYRSFAQWVGGAGFIVMVLAVFKKTSGKSAVLLYGAETPGEKLKPRIKDTARSIWKVYLTLTIFTILYIVAGTYLILPDYPIENNLFDAVNHAMAALSTGGFSNLDDSIATYNSEKMELMLLFPMILGALSIPLYYKVIYQRHFSELWHDIQTRAIIIAFIAGSAALSYLLYYADSVSDPLRAGIFQFVSAMSTTGWQTSNIGQWHWLPIVFTVTTAMFVGGASGSTVGGIKMIRALLISKGLIWQINKSFISENTVKAVRFGNKKLNQDEMNEAFTKAVTVAILFLILVLSSALAGYFLTGQQVSFAACLFESASAQGTVGLSAGITDPSMSPILESIYIFQMWAGRLEIIPVLALLRALLWGARPKLL